MHQPRPYGLSVRGGELTGRDQDFISATVLRFTNYKRTGELDSLKRQYELPDGGFFIVQDMGEIFKVFAYKDNIEKKVFPENGYAHSYVPMFFSGVFERLFFRDHEKWLSLKITNECRKRLSNYTDASNIPKNLELERFAIDYPDKFIYLKPQISGPYFRHTQYMKIKPTLYSGAMAEVIQIISGYGRPYNPDYPTEHIENAQILLPDEVIEKIEKEIKGYMLPACSGYPDVEGFIHYDYKPYQNDLVAFDRKNSPWLIQIQASGVYAMPLPVVPATTTQAFREYIETVGDDEILKILNRFKGMPTGEPMPTGNDFHAWVRAGVIIKVCESADFYNYQSLYGACGWSMNSKGTEAFNTCWEYRNDGLMQVYGYKLGLYLGPIHDNGYMQPAIVDSSILSDYISKLYALLEKGSARSNAIIYKIRRVDKNDLMNRAVQTGGIINQNEVDYWDNYIAKPIAVHSGNMARTTAGSVYWGFPMYPQSMGRFKFPTISGNGCESLVMVSPDYKGSFVKCDTVIFGAYIDDELRYVKYFLDETSFQKKEESTFERGMIVGKWEKTTTVTPSGLSGYFYTSDSDDRRVNSPSTVYTQIVGTDMGYGNPAYQTPGLLSTHGSLYRARYYKHITKTESITGNSMDCAVCIPNFNRDCILYAFTERIESKSNNEKHALYAMADPTSYKLWTYDPIFHYLGGSGKGKPSPTTGDYVYVYEPTYRPTEFSDFADSGDWYGVGSGYVDVSAICAPYTDRSAGVHHAAGVIIGGEGPTIEPYDVTKTEKNINKGRVDLTYQHVGAKTVHKNIPDAWYFSFSPVESGGSLIYFQRDACKVLFGDAEYANISDEGATGKIRKKWGYSSLVDNTAHHYFIGVINE